MSDDVALLLALGALHLVAIAAGAGLILLTLRGDPGAGQDDRRDDDGGTPVRPSPERPRGGPPLPRSDPSRVRLRGSERSPGRRPRRPRRGPVEPSRPSREVPSR
jgi:hypothetical protein